MQQIVFCLLSVVAYLYCRPIDMDSRSGSPDIFSDSINEESNLSTSIENIHLSTEKTTDANAFNMNSDSNDVVMASPASSSSDAANINKIEDLELAETCPSVNQSDEAMASLPHGDSKIEIIERSQADMCRSHSPEEDAPKKKSKLAHSVPPLNIPSTSPRQLKGKRHMVEEVNIWHKFNHK